MPLLMIFVALIILSFTVSAWFAVGIIVLAILVGWASAPPTYKSSYTRRRKRQRRGPPKQ
jgi:hypothetical protein